MLPEYRENHCLTCSSEGPAPQNHVCYGCSIYQGDGKEWAENRWEPTTWFTVIQELEKEIRHLQLQRNGWLIEVTKKDKEIARLEIRLKHSDDVCGTRLNEIAALVEKLAALKKTCECGHDPADHEPGCNEDEISCCTFLGCECVVYEPRYKPLEKLAAIKELIFDIDQEVICYIDEPEDCNIDGASTPDTVVTLAAWIHDKIKDKEVLKDAD